MKAAETCSVCKHDIEATPNAIRANKRKNGGFFICYGCFKKRKAENAAPKRSIFQCARCGKQEERSTARYRHSLRKHGEYVCHACACVPPPRKEVRVIDIKHPITCATCGTEHRMSYNKWLANMKKPKWECRSCSSKAAYASGIRTGTKGMKFKEVGHKDERKRLIVVECPSCGEHREITAEAALVATDSESVSAAALKTVLGTHDVPFSHPGCVCLKCASKEVGLGFRSNTGDFVTKARAKHGEAYDYSKVSYMTVHDPVTITCHEHGDFTMKPADHLYGRRCPVCSRQVSKQALEISEFLTDNGFDNLLNDKKVLSKDPDKEDGLELDIIVPEHRFAIEFHGLYWHGIPNPKRPLSPDYHKLKWEQATEAGWRLIQIFEDEWEERKDLIKQMILHRLGRTEFRVFARKCLVGEVPNDEARKFFASNHVQGADKPVVAYGLYDNEGEGRLVCCLSFYRPPISGGDRTVEWLISRFACLSGVAVVGGFSRLIRHFIKEQSPKSIGTYSDLRWGGGEVYLKNGFEFSHRTAPGYSYYDPQNRHGKRKLKRQHRFGFRKSRLKDLMGEDFNPDETEFQNSERYGLMRLYDAGNAYYKMIVDK